MPVMVAGQHECPMSCGTTDGGPRRDRRHRDYSWPSNWWLAFGLPGSSAWPPGPSSPGVSLPGASADPFDSLLSGCSVPGASEAEDLAGADFVAAALAVPFVSFGPVYCT